MKNVTRWSRDDPALSRVSSLKCLEKRKLVTKCPNESWSAVKVSQKCLSSLHKKRSHLRSINKSLASTKWMSVLINIINNNPKHMDSKSTFKRIVLEIKYLRKMIKSAMFSTMNSGTNRSPVGVCIKKY